MAINNTQRGFALLVAVVFMSVMLSFGLALGSLGYKQQVLASGAIESQYAFYAADAALECALYADQQLGTFAYPAARPASAPLMTCAGVSATFPADAPTGILSYTASRWVVKERLSFDPVSGSGARCADVTIYKPPPNSGATYLFAQGYDVSCATVSSSGGTRFVSRGIHATY